MSEAPVGQTYGILGHPVAHSVSPAIHLAAFQAAGLPHRYVALEAAEARGGLAALRQAGLSGASVTMPLKVTLLPHLDQVDDIAQAIGAVNTISVQDGRLSGHNTDWTGAVRALEEITAIAGRKVVLIGAGGAARAVAYGLARCGARTLIVNRTPSRGAELARSVDADFLPLAELSAIEGDILINATPVGMSPQQGVSLVTREQLDPGTVVFDLVYRPDPTRMLREAASAGCPTVGGTAMLIYQAAEQFELWTGLEAPLSSMREAARRELEGRS